jgi:hypothetical protein
MGFVTVFKKISKTPIPLCFTSSFNRLNFRGAFFVTLSLSKCELVETLQKRLR